jgi:regulator of sigma E protease
MLGFVQFFLIPMLILSILIMIHELGHFFVAKRTGVRVDEFGFGLPPRLIGKKIGETIYSLNALPFGGFVRLAGEDIDRDEGDMEAAYKDPRNFMSKTPLQRAAILTAGVIMNFLLAVFLYYIFFFSTGFKTFSVPLFFDYNFRFGHAVRTDTVVMFTAENSPAEAVSINVGEAIVEIDGTAVYNISDIRRNLADRSGEEVTIILKDVRSLQQDLRKITVAVEPNAEGQGTIGVMVGSTVVLDYQQSRLLAGPMHAYNMLAYSGSTLGGLVRSSYQQRSIEPVSASVAGPVGIFSIVGGVVKEGRDPLLTLIDLTALLSITLAFINILPFPALDGGRLVFVAIEKLQGRRINPHIEANFHKFGMIFLLALMLLVTFRDISRLF